MSGTRWRRPVFPPARRLRWWTPWLILGAAFVAHVSRLLPTLWDITTGFVGFGAAVIAVLLLESRHARQVQSGTAEILVISDAVPGRSATEARIAELEARVDAQAREIGRLKATFAVAFAAADTEMPQSLGEARCHRAEFQPVKPDRPSALSG